MKNILKKIGVIGIIIAMLAPFVEMPVAKAATETCTDHTVMQYYFADVTNGDYWKQYTSTNGYTTYTIYPYLFPEESGKTIKILNTKVLDIETGSTPTSENGMTLEKFWSDVELLQRSDFQKSGDDLSGTYVSKDKSDYRVVKILHGIWGRDTNGSYESVDWTNIPTIKNDFLNYTVQDIFGNNSGITVSSARFLGLNKGFGAADERKLEDYFKNLTSGDNNEYIEEVNGKKVFALRVSRKLDVDTLNTKKFGYLCATKDSCGEANVNKYAIFTDDSADNPIKNSYSALVKAKNLEKIETDDTVARKIVNDEEDVDVFTNKAYYWPAVLNVEYEVCTNTSEQWTLKYDGNTPDDSATNLPQPDTIKNIPVGTGREVDAKTPSRSGYTFKGWNTKSDGTGTWYKAGQEVKSDVADVITLFAQWGDTSKGEQKSTGVASYIIGFVSVGIVAGGIYLIAKKKNLFKQI